MKRKLYSLAAVPLWLSFWVLLAGADGSCFGTEKDCEGLNEQDCLETEGCRPVYAYGFEDGLRCAPGTRCIGPEVFDHCEAVPDCAGLEESACLGEPACQAVYGYPDEPMPWADGATVRCAGGTRCIDPPIVFIECLDADADPCQGLVEEECLRRPACEAEYSYGGCNDEMCWDGIFYEGCHLRGDQCRTDDDCTMYGGADIREGCTFACELGQCVLRCEEPIGCQSDADCAPGERCEMYCGNGWCEGVCVPNQGECQVNEDCPAGFECQIQCVKCAPDDQECPGCFGTCVPIEQGCYSDQDCPEGQHCVWMPCDCLDEDPDCMEKCVGGPGFCIPDDPDCRETGCPEGQECQVTCEECPPGADCLGGCVGTCVSVEYECFFDADCGDGRYCEPLPNVDCYPGSGCPGTCQQGAWAFFAPRQCEQTPWEIDREAFPELYYECMVDIDCADDFPDCGMIYEEICNVQVFLRNQGIWVHDVRDVQVFEEVCAACGCPRGNVLYVLVSPYDLERTLALGFLPF